MDKLIGILAIVAFFVLIEARQNKKDKKGPIGKLIGKKLFKF